MSDHWKSTPKYWCKHCTIYVKDTSFERKQHEATGKHQGNLRRFLQGIQKDHQKNEREKERSKAEIDRLNRIAGTSSSSSAPPTAAATSTKSSKPTLSTLSAGDQKRQWAQLAEMGIAVPQNSRAEMTMPGDWQTTSRKVIVEAEEPMDEKLSKGIRKRKLEDDEGREEDVVVRKVWGSTTKSYPGQQDTTTGLDQLLATPILKRVTKDRRKASSADQTKSSPVTPALSCKHGLPTTKPEATLGDSDSPSHGHDQVTESAADLGVPQSRIKLETFDNSARLEAAPAAAPLFKKRKPKQPSASVPGPG